LYEKITGSENLESTYKEIIENERQVFESQREEKAALLAILEKLVPTTWSGKLATKFNVHSNFLSLGTGEVKKLASYGVLVNYYDPSQLI
jgi:hypothetical protein